MMETYLTIKNEIEHKTEINRSVFICNVKGIKSFDEGMEYIKLITKKYGDATHNCYALITTDQKQKFSDDGEPGGTAGQPILNVIKNKNLYNLAAVVTRYFGGIKLGAGGLVSAYSSSVSETLKRGETVQMVYCQKGRVKVSYNELEKLLNHIRVSKYILLDTFYSESVNIEFACRLKEKSLLQDYISALTSGKSVIEWLEKDYYITA